MHRIENRDEIEAATLELRGIRNHELNPACEALFAGAFPRPADRGRIGVISGKARLWKGFSQHNGGQSGSAPTSIAVPPERKASSTPGSEGIHFCTS
jgi:hypothetical protein